MKHLILLTLWCASVALAQQSDLETKTSFEAAYRSIAMEIDAAKTQDQLDSLRGSIDALESRYAEHRAFLDRALHPETFAEKIEKLRTLHGLTYERVYLIQSQGITISEYEARLASLTQRLDSLTNDRDRLFAELRESKKSLADLRQKMRSLSKSLEARDRLLFALTDSIFLPYDKNLSQTTEVQKEAVVRKLLKSNVVARVYDIASDNVKFLEVTQVQPSDYASLFEQQQQFKSKWIGLREKMNAVALASGGSAEEASSGSSKSSGKGRQKATHSPGTDSIPALEPVGHVDAVINQWEKKLHASFWKGLEQEFSSKRVTLQPFTDGESFAMSVLEYVDSAKTDGRDVFVFVHDIWKDRIDKHWRATLEKESVLGKQNFATLDKAISELDEKKFDMKFVLYILGAAVVAFGAWWFFTQRKPATQKA